ncbi:hypothetical protein EV188_105280 [Actinomycetospora succinea]|uniref:Uncharacterized protein n=1 Tax=Actinomycetospora succinea TaxID=663603 RepID=A0A4R6V974_9PSEU|nr:hypothetical protein [Actinomycetospora succinea]TDQ55882.1 hypothetical protein EV188_105280 [Actinomycetospora succinea]
MTDRFYEFRVDGSLPAQAREAFCDMEVREIRPGAVLRGAVIDDAHLHGILEQLRLLGLTVVSAHPLPAAPES